MSEPWREPIRRNAIRPKDVPAIAVIAAMSAMAAMFAGCRPTGAPLVDGLLTAGLAVGAVWLGASASWWVLVLVGAISTAAAGSLPGVAVAVVAIAIALWLGNEGRSVVPLRCASAALLTQVLLRLGLHPFFGASAVIAGVAFLLLLGLSAQRRREPVRRRILFGLAAGAGLAVVAVIGFAVAAATATSDLANGYQGVLDGLSQLQSGDVRIAASTLHDAAAQLRQADDRVSAPWSQPARLVPIVAQHRNALASIVGEAASAADAAADALDVIDLDSLTIDAGVIDVNAVAALAEPLADLRTAVTGLSDALDAADSPWLISPVRERLTRYRTRATKAAQQATATSAAAATGPAMLGSDGLRRYLVAFCSPAEARGAMGVMGNYAVITMDGGSIEQTAFGRTTDLVDAVKASGPLPVDLSGDFLTRYTRYGLDANGAATAAMWSNATMTPDVPSAAALLAQMWEASGHEPLDGVFFIDPAGLAALLKATGPITVEGLDGQFDSRNLERFLLLDQYAADTPERADLLAQVANATLDAILTGQLPGPQILARDLAPAAASGHIAGWARRDDEEALLRAIGIDASLPRLEGRDGLAIVTNNASANKIDTFLERSIDYSATVHDGRVEATLTIRLHNTAPATGYPAYVLGSEFLDLPSGTNRTLLTAYTPLAYQSATLDGDAIGLTADTELGWSAYTLQLDLAPGETRIIVLSLSGAVTADDYALVVRPQPMARPDTVSIDVSGDATVHWSGAPTRRLVIDERGAAALR